MVRISSFVAAAALAVSASAQKLATNVTILSSSMGGSAPVTNLATGSGSGKNFVVMVGGAAGLVFTPPTINAAVGDTVEFQFMSNNHTLTQSSFANPCVKLAEGADSGFMPNANNTVNPAPSFKIQVDGTSPLWFYCRQKTPVVHCGKGMAFSINPTAAKSQDAFVQLAIAQNGTDASAATPPPPPAAAPASVDTATATAAAAATGTDAAAAAVSTVAGTGTTNSDGSCSCSCLCGTNNFLAAGGFGGLGGSIGMAPMGRK